MILTKELVPDSSDAPPAYNDAVLSSNNGASTSTRPPPNEKDPLGLVQGPQPLTGFGSSSSSASSSPWIYLNPEFWRKQHVAYEVRRTVIDVIRDVVKDASMSGTVEILQNCLTSCRIHGLSFESLIQEPCIEGHTPLYWAIISAHQRLETTPDQDDSCSIVDYLFSFPLDESTMIDARTACMLNDDNDLYQRMRRAPGFTPRTYADTVIVGDNLPPAYINVTQAMSGGVAAFSISFTIEKWVQRIRATKVLQADFIARGRAWKLRTGIAQGRHDIPDGRWFASLSLHKGSAATYVDGVLVFRPAESGKGKVVSLPLRSKRRRCMLGEGGLTELCVRLDSDPGTATLEFQDSPYLTSDGSLKIEGTFYLEYRSKFWEWE